MRRTSITYLLLAVIALMTAACSTQKNTAKSRWWQSFTARYNTYYNGKQAYISGSLEKEKGNKDNFTEMLPVASRQSPNGPRAAARPPRTRSGSRAWSITPSCGKHGCCWASRSL